MIRFAKRSPFQRAISIFYFTIAFIKGCIFACGTGYLLVKFGKHFFKTTAIHVADNCNE